MTIFRHTRDLLLFTVGLLALWQVLHLIAGDVAITAPLPTLEHMVKMVSNPRFLPNLYETSLAFLFAVMIAWGLGLLIGITLGGYKFAGRVAEPLLVALYSIPKITLYPVILLLFGLGMDAKVAFGAFHGIIPVALFTMNAVKNVNRTYIRTGQVLRLNPWQQVRHILLPATLPEIFTGLRIGFSLTLLGTMLGELFASQRGLGFLLMTAIELHEVKAILSIAVFVSVFAVLSSGALLAIDRYLRRGAAVSTT